MMVEGERIRAVAENSQLLGQLEYTRVIISEMSEKFQKIHDALPENNFRIEDQKEICDCLVYLLQEKGLKDSLPLLQSS